MKKLLATLTLTLIAITSLGINSGMAQERPPSVRMAEQAIREADTKRLAETGAPTFRWNLSQQNRAKAAQEMDRAFTAMSRDLRGRRDVPKDIHQGIRIWQSMTPEQRIAMLSSGRDPGTAAIPTWAVAAVGAANLLYQVGKDYNWWGKKSVYFIDRQFSERELDYVKTLKQAALPVPGSPFPGDTALDYHSY